MPMHFRKWLPLLGVLMLAASATPALAQISGTPVSLVQPPPGRNAVAYDSVNQVYLVTIGGHPITAQFYNKSGAPLGGAITISFDDPSGWTGWASVAFGGTSGDPTFLVTYTSAEAGTHFKFSRLIRYNGGSPTISPRSSITHVGHEWFSSERAQSVWNGSRFVVGTRVNVSGVFPEPIVHHVDLAGNVTGGQLLGDGADYYGSPAMACAPSQVCMVLGFANGLPFGGMGGTYARRFNGGTLQPLGNMFYTDDHSSRMEDQGVVYMSHVSQFLAVWWRADFADTRVINEDGSMGPINPSVGPHAGDLVPAYNSSRQTVLLVTKVLGAHLHALELAANGLPANPGNTVLVTNWDGVWPVYAPAVAANNADGQWLVVTRQTSGGRAVIVHASGGAPAPPSPTPAAAPIPASFTAPTAGATVSLPVTFQWTPRSDASAYYLYVGTSSGAKDLVDTGEISATSRTVNALPPGQTLFARIWTLQAGVWRSSEITFAAQGTAASFIFPTNGATNINLGTPFQWTTASGAQAYYLYVGTAQGSRNLVDTGEIHTTSYSVSGLPSGQTLWARIHTLQGGVWRFNDAAFTVAAPPPVPATLLNPLNGLDFDPAQAFRWTSATGAQAYYLYVGTSSGAKNLADSGEIASTGFLPANALPGRTTLFARIHTKLSGSWHFTEVSFSVSGASFIYPSHGDSNVDIGYPFRWTPISNAQAYYLYVGTSPGAKDLVDTGEIFGTTYPVTNLPAGIPLFATLWTKVNGTWTGREISFTAAALDLGPPLPLATMLEPATGLDTFNSARMFRWTAAPGAEVYYLYVGTTQGAKNIVDTGELRRVAHPTIALPAGQTLWARVWTRIGGVWQSTDAVFASPGAAFVYPVAGTVMNSAYPFRWSGMANAEAYYLYVGTSPGAKDILDSGELGRAWYYAPGLPTGVTLYATIWTKADGVWRGQQVAFSVRP